MTAPKGHNMKAKGNALEIDQSKNLEAPTGRYKTTT
jgi:hypothetical protein